MRIHDPDLNARERRPVAFWLKTKHGAEINHASHTQADDDTAIASIGLHHGRDEVLASAFEVGIAGDGLDFVRDVVMFEKPGEDPARAEGIGLEGHED
jgi:hypothetical protein